MDMFGKKVTKDERESLELAEDARQSKWEQASYLKEIFQGNFLWPLIYPFPEQSASEKKIGDDLIEKIGKILKEKLDPEEVDRTHEIPQDVVDSLFEVGAFALKIPKEYDGLGLSKVNYGRIMHYVASYCGSTAVLLSAHQSIGVPQPLIEFGTEEQKKKYLPKFRKNSISAFALTEPHAGSDPRLMTTTAKPTEDGKHFIINGKKLWCTNGVIADVIVVMAVTPPKIINGKEKKQITAFIVEADTPGFKVEHRCQFMGLHGIQNGVISFENVKVPRENIILGEGEGLRLALQTLNTGRLTMPVAVTGASKWALMISRLWANKRTQWGAEIGKHEAIANKIARMTATVFAMDAVGWLTTHMADQKKTDIRLEAAMAKLFCTEAGWKIIDDALQIRGGRGYESHQSLKDRGEADDAYPIERAMRDSRINLIIEGTSEIMHLFITREALDSHLEKMKFLFNKKSTTKDKIGSFFKMMVFYLTWYPKLWFPVIGCGGRYISEYPVLNKHVAFAHRMSKKLARSMFHKMAIHMQGLAQKQNLVGRFVEIASEIYAISAVASYAVRELKSGKPEKETLELADLYCKMARDRIWANFHAVRSNQDKLRKSVSQSMLNEKYTWLENDILK